MDEQENEPRSSRGRCDRKPVANLINEVASTSREGINEEISRLIEEWEAHMNHKESATEIEMEDWKILVPVPGHSRGRVIQFKQTLYLYWLMKSLLGKAIEKISMSMATTI